MKIYPAPSIYENCYLGSLLLLSGPYPYERFCNLGYEITNFIS
jgi:hypothetical protein